MKQNKASLKINSGLMAPQVGLVPTLRERPIPISRENIGTALTS